jgi:hypothetical protein
MAMDLEMMLGTGQLVEQNNQAFRGSGWLYCVTNSYSLDILFSRGGERQAGNMHA